YSYSKETLESQISSLYGGRLAEELIFGQQAVTTGASNDIQRATELAHNMVTKWGLSDNMGPLSYGEDDGDMFMGRGGQHKGVSDLTAKQIDEDVRIVINRNYERAKDLLVEHMEKLHIMAKLLIKYETIDSAQIDAIMEGREPGEPKDWTDRSSTPPPSASAESDSSESPSGKPADQLP
ncbi:hypothetical protein LCGC14_1437170, partial [marine sediment metagenome]